jgi:hypothetical protein
VRLALDCVDSGEPNRANRAGGWAWAGRRRMQTRQRQSGEQTQRRDLERLVEDLQSTTSTGSKSFNWRLVDYPYRSDVISGDGRTGPIVAAMKLFAMVIGLRQFRLRCLNGCVPCRLPDAIPGTQTGTQQTERGESSERAASQTN